MFPCLFCLLGCSLVHLHYVPCINPSSLGFLLLYLSLVPLPSDIFISIGICGLWLTNNSSCVYLYTNSFLLYHILPIKLTALTNSLPWSVMWNLRHPYLHIMFLYMKFTITPVDFVLGLSSWNILNGNLWLWLCNCILYMMGLLLSQFQP